MKKIFLTALFVLLPCLAHATATAEAIVETRAMNDTGLVEVRYALDTCAASTSCEYAIAMPSIKGRVQDVRLESASTDADVHLAYTTGETIKGYTTIWSYETCNLGCAAEAGLDEPYFNDDTTPAATLYFTVDNQDSSNATGVASLILEVQKGRY